VRRGDGSATKERTKYAVHDDGALREPQVAASSKPDGRSLLRIMFGVANRTGGRRRFAAIYKFRNRHAKPPHTNRQDGRTTHTTIQSAV
jgi:hypothetical protein